MSEPLSPQLLSEWAVRYLARFPASKVKLSQHLRQKIQTRARYVDLKLDNADELIMACVEQLETLGLIDDKKFIEARAHYYQSRGFSLSQIAYKLTQEGVERDLIDTVFQQELETESLQEDFETALNFAKNQGLGQWRDPQPPHDSKQFNRDMGKMARRGFSPALSYKILYDKIAD